MGIVYINYIYYAFFINQMNWLDYIYIVVILIFSLSGAVKGFSKIAISIIAFFLSYKYSSLFIKIIFQLLRTVFDYQVTLDSNIIYILSFIVVFLVIYIVLILIVDIIKSSIGFIKVIDYLVGFLAGLALSVIFLGVISTSIDSIFSIKDGDIRKESLLYNKTKELMNIVK